MSFLPTWFQSYVKSFMLILTAICTLLARTDRDNSLVALPDKNITLIIYYASSYRTRSVTYISSTCFYRVFWRELTLR
ncbi:hypothetical protein V1511DRAFT_504431 [Dipodascopsis uninucleata]